MERLNKLRPMMIFVLISQLFFACATDQEEFIAENINEENVDGVFAEATIYYEQGNDKYAIVYNKNGEKKTFNNGKKVGQTNEAAPDPITAPENADNVEIIEGDAWTDEEAISETAPEGTTSNGSSQELSAEVMYWKNMFDTEWAQDKQDAISRSLSKNKNQEYYYLAYYVDGLIQVWQATGDNAYLDSALELINNTMNDAVDVGGGYRGWPAYNGNTYALWDSFYWRFVSTLVRVMHQSPDLRAQGDYQAQYEKLLEFSEKHIWERWQQAGEGNFYRSKTHMTSHWARISMELYVITGNSRYKSVFDKISFGQMDGRKSNLRDQIFSHPNVSGGILWDASWGVSKGSDIQDTSHAAAIVSFWVSSYENNMYWNKGDIDAVTATLLESVWPDQVGGNFYEYIDGVGGYDKIGRLHEWLVLGRYNSKVQSKLKNDYTAKNLDFFGSQAVGIAALNQRMLEDSKASYPEN